MADWTRGMNRTYEFWRVNPATWGDAERIDTITDATIKRDMDLETLGSAAFTMDAWEGEMYVRTYLVTFQDGVRERWPLGTHLLIADSEDFDGAYGSSSVDAYTPLKELLDDMPPLGFTIAEGSTLDRAKQLMELHGRMPVLPVEGGSPVTEAYTADPDSDTWLSLISGFLAKTDHRIELDTYGRALIAPMQDSRSMMPAFTFDDGNSSIMQPAVKVDSNMPEVPNVVEVVYSKDDAYLSCELVNDAPGSITSTASRGRVVRHRESSPELPDNPTQADVDDSARRLMREMGSATYEVTFTHGFVPDVAPGVAVRLNYSAMGLDVVAVIASQTIRCTPSCQVESVARFTREAA